MVLPDTSVWIDYLRAQGSAGAVPAGAAPAGAAEQADGVEDLSPADELDLLIERQEVVTCGPVVAELVAGTRGSQRESLATQLAAQPWVDLKRSDWPIVGQTAARLRERGETVPLIDVQIAVCAVLGDAQLWTCDHDFERIARTLDGLRLRMITRPSPPQPARAPKAGGDSQAVPL
jgi:predicted nucleic acid-binding protein